MCCIDSVICIFSDKLLNLYWYDVFVFWGLNVWLVHFLTTLLFCTYIALFCLYRYTKCFTLPLIHPFASTLAHLWQSWPPTPGKTWGSIYDGRSREPPILQATIVHKMYNTTYKVLRVCAFQTLLGVFCHWERRLRSGVGEPLQV